MAELARRLSLLAFALACHPTSGPPAPAPAPAVPRLEARSPDAGASPPERAPRTSVTRTRGSDGAHQLVIGQSRIAIHLEPGGAEGREAAVLAWIERCARAVAGYYGEFPVPALTIAVRSSGGAGIRGGQAFPGSQPSIRISVGEHTRALAFERNWSMTHEMVHLAFPDVPSAHHWVEEGLATFVEPIARARAGWITEDAVWAEWIENMPLGLPGPGDGGLDGTDSWGRTYWGGALFCLVAAVALLERTDGRRSLDDALRGIVAAGGNISSRWSLLQALRAGDAATGERVLLDTYTAMKDTPVRVELDGLWRSLGVAREAGRIRYDDAAPLARVRRALVAGRATFGTRSGAQ